MLFRIGLTTDKPIPLGDIARALGTIRSIKASLTNLISILKPLINDADIALRTTPRPACGVDCQEGCTGGGMCYRDIIVTFDKVIGAGGPMCFLQTPNPKLLPTCYSHLQIPSKVNVCPLGHDHDHLHITNNHRTLLENMQLQVDHLRASCSTLTIYNWTYHNIPLRLDGKKQRSHSLDILRIVEHWNDISTVRSEYEWVWGGPDRRGVSSWKDFRVACKDVAGVDSLDIDEFNLMILINNKLIRASNPTRKKKRRSWSMESMNKKPPASALYPDGRRSISTPAQPKPTEGDDFHERCEKCDESIEISRIERQVARAAAEAAKRPGGPEPPKSSETPPNSSAECVTAKSIPKEPPLYGIPREFEQVFARVIKMVTKSEVLTDGTGRFTTKAKGKWRCEEGASAEEESVLYNRNFAPKAKELCAWCRERKRVAENTADAMRKRGV